VKCDGIVRVVWYILPGLLGFYKLGEHLHVCIAFDVGCLSFGQVWGSNSDAAKSRAMIIKQVPQGERP